MVFVNEDDVVDVTIFEPTDVSVSVALFKEDTVTRFQIVIGNRHCIVGDAGLREGPRFRVVILAGAGRLRRDPNVSLNRCFGGLGKVGGRRLRHVVERQSDTERSADASPRTRLLSSQ